MRCWVLLLALGVVQSQLTFGPPIALGPTHWGVTFTAQFSESTFAAQISGALALTTDAGGSFQTVKSDVALTSNLIRTADGLHDFGTVTSKIPGSSWTNFSSDTFHSWDFENGTVKVSEQDKKITFTGLPRPATCGKFACPFRLQGCGAVTLKDGTMLQTAIISWGGNVHSPNATSVVCFRSMDGEAWEYLSTVGDAQHYQWSEEGPNEHDLALLDSGAVLAVVRMDGGDGPETHPFVDYSYTLSHDQGKTWSPLVTMNGTGCARPRLVKLPGGPLLLSGGRMKNEGTDDNLVWVDMTGPTDNGEMQWTEFALSYYHDALSPPSFPKFSSAVNSTTAKAQTAAYTALVVTGRCSAVVLYDLVSTEGRDGYAMRIMVDECH